MARPKSLPPQRQINVGDKVKVHETGKPSQYGEVLGIRKDFMLVLHRRDDFATLPLSAFDHFREANQVVFLHAATVEPQPYQIRCYSWDQYLKMKEVQNG